MRIPLRPWVDWICLLSLIILPNSCTSTSEKITHKAYIVEIKDMQFQPAEITVAVGDTVVWINRDIVAHDVTEESNHAWSSTPLLTGKFWSFAVTKSANYYCSIHQVMKGKILVP